MEVKDEQKGGAILDIAVAVGSAVVSLRDLAHARGVEPEKYRMGLGCDEMSVCDQGEDVITLAATAGWEVLRGDAELVSRVGMCIVGTESGVDGAKSIASTMHRLLGLPSACRVFDVQHACYGATAALQMARDWALLHPHKLALVVATDIARYERLSAGEPTQGAGAVAMLVGVASAREACLTLSRVSGTYANDVHDFWRPSYQKTALVKGKYSVSCYLDGLVAAYEDYHRQEREAPEPDYMLFHAPFPHMARKAHKRLMEHRGWQEEALCSEDYARRVLPSLWANRRVGNIYTGSLYLSLAALCEQEGESLVGKRISLFSYGSGSCSEYFTGTFGHAIAKPQLRSLLDARCQVDIAGYEALCDVSLAMEQEQSHGTDISPREGQPFTFLGIRDHERVYRQNDAYWRAHIRRDRRSHESGASVRIHARGYDPSAERRSLFDGATRELR